jgi:hypothetical protein
MSSSESSESRTPSPSSTVPELDGFHGLSISKAPETPMDEVRRFFSNMSSSAVLQFAFGEDKPDAPDSAKDVIMVVMDCEKHEYEPRILTEYGLHIFTRKDMLAILNNPGPYGEKLLRQIYYYHMRLRDNAHLANRKHCKGDPEKNHFGVTRFFSKPDAKGFLSECLAWLIDEHNPDDAKCPVIFLGFALDNELHMLQQELGVDATVFDNVVTIVDTQTIANEQGVYGRGNKIGLEDLINRYNVDFRDGHTASNDAAYTVIAAMQMVMQTQLPQAPKRSLQEVVNDLEVVSQETNPGWYSHKYCTRCASTRHKRPDCRGDIKQCEKCLKADNAKMACTHVTKFCTR